MHYEINSLCSLQKLSLRHQAIRHNRKVSEKKVTIKLFIRHRHIEAKIATDTDHRRSIEDDMASRAGLEPGYVAIDVPSVKLLLSEPRMSQVDIRVLGDDGRTRWLKDHTPIADALKRRQVSQAAAYVMTIPGHESRVSELVDLHLMS